jgi:hypothetical protein
MMETVTCMLCGNAKIRIFPSKEYEDQLCPPCRVRVVKFLKDMDLGDYPNLSYSKAIEIVKILQEGL